MYFPFISINDFEGWTTLNNFPPNNWEIKSPVNSYISCTWVENNNWKSKTLKEISPFQSITINKSDINNYENIKSLIVLSLSKKELPENSSTLPMPMIQETSLPVWRASIGLSSANSSSSYQGEIMPFPPKASLLSFAPFVQIGKDIENYLIFLNLEKVPNIRESEICISDTAHPNKIRKFSKIKNNFKNTISLDDCNFQENEIPLISCKDMTGLPIYVSINKNNKSISIEHSHPGASFVVHGERWKAQKILKNLWFKKIYNEN